MNSKTFKIRRWFRRKGAGGVVGVVSIVIGVVLVVVLLIVGEVRNAPGQRSSAPAPAHARTPAPSPAPASPAPAPPAGNAVFNRTDLIYGSQIGAWDTNGGAVASNPLAFSNARRADIRVVRFQMFDRPAELGGTESTATFDSALATIHHLGAIPLIDLPPNSGRQLPGGPEPWSYQWQQWVVQHAVAKGAVLFEMANEPDNLLNGGLTAAQYFYRYWVDVPRLKAYARSLGYTIYIGGPAWAGWYPDDLAQIETFLRLCKRAYYAHGDNRDWIPDFVSVHLYGGGPSTGGQAQINRWGHLFDRLRVWMDANMPYGRQIKLVNSEYNYAIQAQEGTTWQDQAAMTAYYNAMFAMARAKAPDGSQRLWMMNQFCIDSGNSGLDLLNPDGTVRPAYIAFKANSIAALSTGN